MIIYLYLSFENRVIEGKRACCNHGWCMESRLIVNWLIGCDLLYYRRWEETRDQLWLWTIWSCKMYGEYHSNLPQPTGMIITFESFSPPTVYVTSHRAWESLWGFFGLIFGQQPRLSLCLRSCHSHIPDCSHMSTQLAMSHVPIVTSLHTFVPHKHLGLSMIHAKHNTMVAQHRIMLFITGKQKTNHGWWNGLTE